MLFYAAWFTNQGGDQGGNITKLFYLSQAYRRA